MTALPPAQLPTHRVVLVTRDGESPEMDGSYLECSRYLVSRRTESYPPDVTYRIDPLPRVDPQEDDGDVGPVDHIAQAALHDSHAELGRVLLEMYDADPDWWYDHLPVVLVARICAHKERFS